MMALGPVRKQIRILVISKLLLEHTTKSPLLWDAGCNIGKLKGTKTTSGLRFEFKLERRIFILRALP